MASLIRTLDRLPFEWPLAGTLGASAAFATLAAPAGPLDDLPGGRVAAAALVALAATPLAWATMRRPHRVAPPAARAPVEPLDTAEEGAPVRMRRADSHPDAPFRQPIRASRDLGTPFMAIGGEEAGAHDAAHGEAPGDAPAPAIAATEGPLTEGPAPDAPVAEDRAVAGDAPDAPEAIAPVEPAAGAEPATMPPADDATVAEAAAPDPVEAVAPPAAAAPETAADDAAPDAALDTPAPGRESLSTLMDRLARGAERRGGVPPRRSAAAIARTADQIREVQPGLRDALATLNRLAERR